MTPTEIDATTAAIKLAYPRLKWTPEEWDIFSEGMRHVDLTADQASAVVRECKRTEDKYPSVALFTRRLKAAEQRPAVTPEQVEQDRLHAYRLLTGLPDASALEVVCRYYRDAAARSVRLRGYVKPEWADDAIQDLIGFAAQSEEAAVSWATRIGNEYPSEPGPDFPHTDEQVWYVEMLDRASERKAPALASHVSGSVEHNARPSRREDARAAWARLRSMGKLADIERKAMAGVQRGVEDVSKNAAKDERGRTD